nr:C2 calcium-dependent membrane targeting [Tanacetum cinerariifolium]
MTVTLQVAAWDANLVSPPKRMGNSSVNLESICDGNSHEVLVELEGMGGGGKVQLEVRYKSFETIEEEKNWWRLPFIGEFLRNNDFESTLRKLVGSEPVQARQFVEYAFGQLKSINDAYIQKDGSSDGDDCDSEDSKISTNSESQSDTVQTDSFPEDSIESKSNQNDASSQSDKDFWKNFGDTVNQNIVKKLGLPAPENIKWEGFDLLSTIGLQSQTVAEAGYIESGLAIPSGQDAGTDKETTDTSAISTIQASLPDIKKATQDLLKQTDSIFGALMVLNATVTELAKDGSIIVKGETKVDIKTDDDSESSTSKTVLDEKKAEEMRTLFSTAESAMEAWAMLATSLGHPSFIKSEFEKICFLDNPVTDTQVRWKDLRTDLMLAPTGLNPERIGGDFKEEIQVHSGFLSAYDSVRTRIISLIKTATASRDGDADPVS